MAKKSMINRELKREKRLPNTLQNVRAELKAIINNVNASDEERFEAILKLQVIATQCIAEFVCATVVV
jgi:small subunit ribosomal protein S14